MDSDKEKMDFIAFIIKATNNKKLATEFLEKVTAEDLYDFFQEKKYIDISLKDCKGILKAATSGHGKGINKDGEPVIFDRSGTKSY